MTDIKVGDTFYMFDENRRFYPRDANGRSIDGPIYRQHFYEVEVIGETSRSWLVGYEWKPTKVPKKDPWSVLYTAEMVENAVWVTDCRWRIAALVSKLEDASKLRQIAEIVGFEE